MPRNWLELSQFLSNITQTDIMSLVAITPICLFSLHFIAKYLIRIFLEKYPNYKNHFLIKQKNINTFLKPSIHNPKTRDRVKIILGFIPFLIVIGMFIYYIFKESLPAFVSRLNKSSLAKKLLLLIAALVISVILTSDTILHKDASKINEPEVIEAIPYQIHQNAPQNILIGKNSSVNRAKTSVDAINELNSTPNEPSAAPIDSVTPSKDTVGSFFFSKNKPQTEIMFIDNYSSRYRPKADVLYKHTTEELSEYNYESSTGASTLATDVEHERINNFTDNHLEKSNSGYDSLTNCNYEILCSEEAQRFITQYNDQLLLPRLDNELQLTIQDHSNLNVVRLVSHGTISSENFADNHSSQSSKKSLDSEFGLGNTEKFTANDKDAYALRNNDNDEVQGDSATNIPFGDANAYLEGIPSINAYPTTRASESIQRNIGDSAIKNIEQNGELETNALIQPTQKGTYGDTESFLEFIEDLLIAFFLLVLLIKVTRDIYQFLKHRPTMIRSLLRA